MTSAQNVDWPRDIFDVLLAHDISIVAHVPDAAHAPLLNRCEASGDIRVVTLTSEQDGVGLLSGAWVGGRRGVLLMQSSGVGNVINALALVSTCRIPILTIVTMRGEWGEFIPWQLPMGQAVPGVLRAMDIRVFRVSDQNEAGTTVAAAATLAYNTRQSTAVLLSQKMIGAKQFSEG